MDRYPDENIARQENKRIQERELELARARALIEELGLFTAEEMLARLDGSDELERLLSEVKDEGFEEGYDEAESEYRAEIRDNERIIEEQDATIRELEARISELEEDR